MMIKPAHLSKLTEMVKLIEIMNAKNEDQTSPSTQTNWNGLTDQTSLSTQTNWNGLTDRDCECKNDDQTSLSIPTNWNGQTGRDCECKMMIKPSCLSKLTEMV